MFNSKAQQGFMESAPKGDKSKKEKSLPSHVDEMSDGGYACMHCGGEVDEGGESVNYEPDEEDNDSPQGEAVDSLLRRARR